MSKEIKEILDELESLFEISEAPEHIINGFNKLKDYITNLQQKVEQLENIIDVKKYDCDYLETLFSKSSKEEVLKAYTYKCEQLEKVMKARNEFEMKAMQLENIRKEAIKYVQEKADYPISYYHCLNDLLNILNKGE